MDPVELSVDAGADLLAGMLDDDLDTIGDDQVNPEAAPKDETKEVTDEPSVEDGDEDVAEDDPEEDDPEADPDETEDPQTQEVTDDTLVDIEIDGEAYEVNFHELKAGYLRNEDYAAKVNVLQKEHDAKVEALEAKQEELLDELRALSVIVTSDTSRYDKINWEALKAQDPEQYQRLRVEALEAKEQAQKLTQRHDQVAALHAKAQQLRHEVYVKQQTELVEKLIPNIREPEVLKGLLAYGQEVGYSPDEIVNMVDARQLLLLHNAMLHAKSVVRKKEAVEKKVSKELPAVVKPGAKKPQSSTDRQVVKNARARLEKEHSVDAAAAVLATFNL